MNGPKIGFYDTSGNVAIPAEYDFASRFYDGISYYSNGKNIFDCKSGILKKTGEKIEIGDFYWVSDWGFEYADDKNRRLFAMRSNKCASKPNVNGKYGFVDRTGKIIIEPQFDKKPMFSKGMYNVQIGFLNGFVNDVGEYVIPVQYDDSSWFNKHGYAIVSKFGDYDRLLHGIVDKSGRLITPLMFNDIEIISKDRFITRSKNGFMLYDIYGNPVTKNEFGIIQYLYDNLALVDYDLSGQDDYHPTGKIYRDGCGDGRYVYFYEYNDEQIEDHIHGFGIMKKDGTILTPQIFDHIGYYAEGLIIGNIVKFAFDYIDQNGNPVLFDCYDACTNFIDGAAYYVTHDWPNGILTVDRVITPEQPLVDGITTFFINKQGDIIDLDFDEQARFLRQYKKIFKESLYRRKWRFEEFIKTE